MSKRLPGYIFALVWVLVFSYTGLCAQFSNELESPRVFLDCKTHCYFEHVRTELNYMSFVRDRQEADVYLLLTSLRTGSGGREYTLMISGRRQYEGILDTLTFYTDANVTDSERQDLIVHNIEKSLIPVLLKSDLKDYITVDRSRVPRVGSISTPIRDPWNSWLFELGGNFWFSKDETSDEIAMSGRLNISRVTDDQKFDVRGNYNYNQTNFKLDDDSTFVSFRRSSSARALYVHSISDHWSIGGWASIWSNTFSNYDLGVSLRPAVEWNLFPYAEATRRQFTFQYTIGPSFNDYVDTTIFDKTSEWLFSHSLEVDYVRLEEWGTIRISLDYSNYLHDWSLLSLSLRPRVSWNITKGLNLNLSAGMSLYRNQRNIVKSGVTTEEQLLRIKQLGSDYAFHFSAGVSYRFGSTYNNVVNTRF